MVCPTLTAPSSSAYLALMTPMISWCSRSFLTSRSLSSWRFSSSLCFSSLSARCRSRRCTVSLWKQNQVIQEGIKAGNTLILAYCTLSWAYFSRDATVSLISCIVAVCCMSILISLSRLLLIYLFRWLSMDISSSSLSRSCACCSFILRISCEISLDGTERRTIFPLCPRHQTDQCI